ncbi:MAG: O-antigen ligase family protein [Myxococcales bacterium]|nr:O-antigen ligase family protein [Myxococcales bacterium]MCB9716868.1 O-antigen ligase family protein [Myxococcales bacterium]
MITSATVIAGLVLTLLLPIYPEGMSPDIAAFFGLITVAAMGGLTHRAARRELMVIAPWGAVLLLGMFVGSVQGGEPRQAVEDTLPYLLFVMGLVAGRGVMWPRRVLVVALAVCVIDSVISLYKMPSFSPDVRSTYTYWKITAGLPLVGMALSALLRHTDPQARSPSVLARPLHGAAMAVMFVAMVATISRGMMLGWVLGAVVTAYIRKPSQMLAAALLLGVAFLVYSSLFAEIGTRYFRADQADTIEGRFREIETAWDTFVHHPLLGAGLGATFEVDGFYKAYVHNMAAYHLWKFGLVGSVLLALPLWFIARQLRASTRTPRAIVIGGAAAIIAYLVTCAAYKTYYLVWIYGVVAGASLSWLTAWRQRSTLAPPEPTHEVAPSGPPGPVASHA